ncbi:hypothetical protein HNR37_000576 [Desulfurispira natronophila]|uniref:Uncharacterized protein n=2 Tax=Desulfurispira natronophila TaxID=682562 RepID=A0A7W8DGC6_9BACT|nr:hypothetical protein [Desulfurispira natronophila]
MAGTSGLQDPTRPQMLRPVVATPEQLMQSVEEKRRDYRIDMIVVGSSPWVVIDGERYREGDPFGDGIIQRITRTQITIRTPEGETWNIDVQPS